VTPAGPRLHRFVLVPIRVEEDVPLARHAVQSSHALRGAVLALDLGGLDPGVPIPVPALVEEFAATAVGNAQRLVLVGAPGGIALPAGVEPYADLSACFDATMPLEGRAHAALLTVPARVELLPHLRHHLGGVVRTLHGEADAFQSELLIDELCLNAVENSTSTRNTYDVAFRCENYELQLDVTNVFDDSVDPARIMHRRLASFDDSGGYLGERGRGLFLIARIADGLQIRSLDDDRIRVSVTKRLRGNPAD
jgi:anti-sigma regulatory factor (Ser/Thr protein kinase)